AVGLREQPDQLVGVRRVAVLERRARTRADPLAADEIPELFRHLLTQKPLERQLPTPNSQLPIAREGQQRRLEVGRWKLGVGSWELTLETSRFDAISARQRPRPRPTRCGRTCRRRWPR